MPQATTAAPFGIKPTYWTHLKLARFLTRCAHRTCCTSPGTPNPANTGHRRKTCAGSQPASNCSGNSPNAAGNAWLRPGPVLNTSGLTPHTPCTARIRPLSSRQHYMACASTPHSRFSRRTQGSRGFQRPGDEFFPCMDRMNIPPAWLPRSSVHCCKMKWPGAAKAGRFATIFT